MGTWGTGLFQNDIANDVKISYITLLKMGQNDEKALLEIISKNRDYLDDPEDCLDFWFALSSVLYDYGRLTDDVKSKAMSLLNSGDDIDRWDEKEKNKRVVVLEKLKEKLNSPIPSKKKVSVTKKFVTPWKKNDIYYVEIKEICDSDKQGFFVFCVSDIVEFDVRIKGLGDILPVTYLKFVSEIPEDIKTIDSLPFIQNFRMDDKMCYRFLWLTDGFSKIKKKFIYGGNFDFTRPDLDFCLTHFSKLSIMKVFKNISQYV